MYLLYIDGNNGVWVLTVDQKKETAVYSTKDDRSELLLPGKNLSDICPSGKVWLHYYTSPEKFFGRKKLRMRQRNT